MFFEKAKTQWSIGVSIPVPRACKARTLPIELMPRTAATDFVSTLALVGR